MVAVAEQMKSLAGQRRHGERAMARCPHCESPARIRTSEEVTILHRDIIFICNNSECGHSWKAQMSFVHSIAVPSNPRPGLDLPVSPLRRRQGEHMGSDPPAMADTG